MRFKLDTTSREPIYQQLVAQIQLAVARGALTAGEKLPSVRALALSVQINPNTVAKAYAELENAGVVVRQHGRGVFVANRTSELTSAARARQLSGHLDTLLVAAWRLDIDLETLVDALRERASSTFSDPEEHQEP